MKKTTENTNIKIENEFAKVTISKGSIVIENNGANENDCPIKVSIGGEDYRAFVSEISGKDK